MPPAALILRLCASSAWRTEKLLTQRERERSSAHHGVVCPSVVVEEWVVFLLELWFQYKNCFTHPSTFPACGDQWTHIYIVNLWLWSYEGGGGGGATYLSVATFFSN